MMKKNDIKTVNESLIDYLISKLNNGQYDTRTYYGELFTALAMAKIGSDKYRKYIKKILSHYFNNEDKTGDQFHWEFNNYALIKLERIMDLSKYVEQYRPLKFKGTKSSNWIMLRGLTRILSGEKKTYGEIELKKTIILMQKKNGLIMDSIYDKSFQYHCFMAYLILEAYNETKDTFYKKSFLKALYFIEKFILRNGEFSYIGRGQKQIFGVGPLLYILQEGYIITKDQKYLAKRDLVYDMLLNYKRENGSFPLVLRDGEYRYPKVINIDENKYLGWYSYNNYFDYLPFLAYFLVLFEASYCETSGNIERDFSSQYNYYDNDFLKLSNNYIDVVVAKPDLKISNSLPIPYVVTHDNSLTSCYGGEESSILYNSKSIPLPWGITNNNPILGKIFDLPYIRDINIYNVKKILKKIFKRTNNTKEYYFYDNLIYNLKGAEIIGENRRIRHSRRFELNNREILIRDIIKFKKEIKFQKFNLIYLLFEGIEKINEKTFITRTGLKIQFQKLSGLTIDKNVNYCCDKSLDSLKYTLTSCHFTNNQEMIVIYKLFL